MSECWRLTEAAIQRCYLKKVFFKESRILKMSCVYIHFFKKVAGEEPAA